MKKDTLQATACSKLILAGEHLVVYGYQGLAIPLPNLLTTVTLQPTTTNPRLVQVLNLEFYTDLLQFTPTQLKHLSHYDILIQTPPMGVGLGISASLAVALFKVLAKFQNKNLTLTQLLDLALQAEILNHTNSSGIDHTTIIYQKPIFFQGSNKKFQILDFELPAFVNQFVLHNSGKPLESTSQMIEFVASRLNKFSSDHLNNLNNEIPNLIQALKAANFSEFSRIINLFGNFLEQIPICTPKVIQENQTLRSQGFATKVCGAGGLTNGSGIILRLSEVSAVNH